jgi:hypothetical protein
MPEVISLSLRLLVALAGAGLAWFALYSAIETLVLPRSAPDLVARIVFRSTRWLFELRVRRAKSYARRDRLLAFYAPVALLLLLPAWLLLVLLGFTAMFWAVAELSWYEAFRISGSSLLTLGFAQNEGLAATLLEFIEATIGLILVALLIAYLPTMYSAFQRREMMVTLLEVRAGKPPSPVEMLSRFQRIHGLARLSELWRDWEAWFADLDESHTSLPALVFFRSPRPEHSWVTAAGAVLDAASLSLAALDMPFDAQAALCIRAGYIALRHVADFFGISYPANPGYPAEPISISRPEFEAALQRLAVDGAPLKTDREQAWQDFAGWRVNYDVVLVRLAQITTAPPAPWAGAQPGD